MSPRGRSFGSDSAAKDRKKEGDAMADERNHKENAVRLALADLGDAPAAELAAFIEDRYGVRIEARFVPIYRATLRAREQLALARAAALATLAQDGVSLPAAQAVRDGSTPPSIP